MPLADSKKIATIAGVVAKAMANIVAANVKIQAAKAAVISHNLTSGLGVSLVTDLNSFAVSLNTLATAPIVATVTAKVVHTHDNNALPGEVE